MPETECKSGFTDETVFNLNYKPCHLQPLKQGRIRSGRGRIAGSPYMLLFSWCLPAQQQIPVWHRVLSLLWAQPGPCQALGSAQNRALPHPEILCSQELKQMHTDTIPCLPSGAGSALPALTSSHNGFTHLPPAPVPPPHLL